MNDYIPPQGGRWEEKKKGNAAWSTALSRFVSLKDIYM
jgi:hypothetical protein